MSIEIDEKIISQIKEWVEDSEKMFAGDEAVFNKIKEKLVNKDNEITKDLCAYHLLGVANALFMILLNKGVEK